MEITYINDQLLAQISERLGVKIHQIKAVLDLARTAIIDQVKNKFPGEEKKAKVDAQVIYAIQQKVAGCSNKLVLWLVGLIVKSIPSITQKIYDFLKEKVEKL